VTGLRAYAMRLALASFLLAACGRDDSPRREVPALPGAVKLAMPRMRASNAALAQALALGDLGAARSPAQQLANTWLARDPNAFPAGFASRDEALRRAAKQLLAALDARDVAAARVAHTEVDRACTACHETFRLLGADAALLR
jgi:hypothetical protein